MQTSKIIKLKNLKNQSIKNMGRATTDDEISQLQNSCRLCLTKNQEISLFDNYQNSNMKFSEIAIILTDNITIHENDNLPKFICYECSLKLMLFYKFKQKCELSHCTLSALLANVIELDPSLNKNDNLNNNLRCKVELNSVITTTTSSKDSSNVSLSNDMKFYKEETDEIKESINIKLSDEIITASTPTTVQGINDKIKPIDIKNERKHALDLINPEIKNDTMKCVWNEVIHQCDQCKQIYSSKSSLKQHYSTHLSEKRFSCELCNKKFTRKNHVIIHMRTHNNIKPYVCEQCNRGFVKSSDLLRHMKVHSDRKDYVCEICGKAFKRSTDISSHMNSHTGKRPYSCKICKKSYYSYSSMTKHCRKFEHHRSST